MRKGKFPYNLSVRKVFVCTAWKSKGVKIDELDHMKSLCDKNHKESLRSLHAVCAKGEGLVFPILKKLLETYKQTPAVITNTDKGFEQFIPKEVELALQHVKKCSSSCSAREMQTPVFIFSDWQKPRTLTIHSVGKFWGIHALLCVVGSLSLLLLWMATWQCLSKTEMHPYLQTLESISGNLPPRFSCTYSKWRL